MQADVLRELQCISRFQATVLVLAYQALVPTCLSDSRSALWTWTVGVFWGGGGGGMSRSEFWGRRGGGLSRSECLGRCGGGCHALRGLACKEVSWALARLEMLSFSAEANILVY
jgi:hypothetical protein